MPFGQDVPRSVLDSLFEGFQVIAPDWSYLYVNPVAAKHGRSRPELLEGQKLWVAYPGIEQSPLFGWLKQVMETRVATSVENRFTFNDGSQRWFELRIAPVPQGICVHSVDIDDRKQAEEVMRLLHEQLECRVAERTQELERSNRDLEQFCYSVSHDLRAPLRAVDGFSALLAEHLEGALDDEGRDFLRRIRAASARMGRLIDELLRLSRVSHEDLSRREVDLSAMAREVMQEFTASEPGRQLEVTIASSLRANADPALARIALENLLNNAFKFTAKTKEARIDVQPSKDEPGAIVIADNGAGFDMQFASTLFRPFGRLHSERDFAGLGVGLATVQRIIDRHHGSVRAWGQVGHGAAFTVNFDPR